MPPRFFARLSPLAIIALLLASVGIGMTLLKAVHYQVPLLPELTTSVWTVEARIGFEGKGGASKVELVLPAAESMERAIDENFVSRGYGLAILDAKGRPRDATWTLRRTPKSEQALYYQVKVAGDKVLTDASVPPFPPVPDYKEPLGSAIQAVLGRARRQSADVFSFTEQTLLILADRDDENVKVIRNVNDRPSWAHLVAEILAGARIPTRIAYGLSLNRPQVDAKLIPWLEVHNGDNWKGYDAATGKPGYPPGFFIWRYDTPDLLHVRGVRNLHLGFSTTQTRVPQMDVAELTGAAFRVQPLGLDLTRLPVSVQNLYRVVLMLPLGALVVAFMRVVIGVPTFGTFMPILIALAFRQTQLLWGLVLFLLLVFVGLSLRLMLTQLRLLLVPRLAAILVVVVCLMLSITLLSYRLGVEQGLSIALLPMVILTMTIERMSIVWEERGFLETAKETIGSLFVAICGFFVMNEPHLMHLMFYFPELLLVVLAALLLLGAYSGYRLTELFRFGALARAR
ncbi:MAG: inactive transglutaminase family protein [Thiohalocapsa sp.]|uniref:UUP1 family membrane protein n=1 Tax=Thiohalocapsa sp. TaxID=2497641 RepID=UPI0025FD5939|nr:UUP1 family membrane protein [Thiohalocapsa sp.]MCG6943066.1 inactive transglutaminase family protein [Thiohalocapsa sp.]